MEKQIRNSSPRKDLTGQIFTYLTPLYYIKGGKWHCRCKCGTELDIDTRNLNSGHTKSCGCLQREKASNNAFDMSNYETEDLKVLERNGSDQQGIALWKTLCKHCGNIFITRGSSVRAGYIKSCGCVHSLNEQNITKLLLENNIEFSTQYTFPDLIGVNGGKLRFDFAIFKNQKLSHLLEYNGKQHYNRAEGTWGENYETTIANDEKKRQYCKEKGICLKVIPYNQEYTIKDLI